MEMIGTNNKPINYNQMTNPKESKGIYQRERPI